MRPGRVRRRDYEYKRCGTANVFCGIEPKADVHFTKVTPTRSSPEFAEFLLGIAVQYPAADTIHLVLDNLSTHSRKALVRPIRRRGRRMAVEAVHRSLHAEACKLAQSGRDRDQPLQPPVPRQTPDRGHCYAAAPGQSLEPPRQSRPHQNQMEIHQKTGAPENALLFYTVEVLVPF
jgi:hypothetical protein